MKKFNFIVLLLISVVANAQNFSPQSISYQEELFIEQNYQNNAPTGYKQSFKCPDSLTFCIITGQFAEDFEINSEEIQLKLEDNSLVKVIGAVRKKNIPEIKTHSYREDLSGNDAPIFIIKKGIKPKQIIISKEEIDLNVNISEKNFAIINLPKLEIVSVKLYDNITNNRIKIGGFSDGFPVELKFTPVKGKVLCVEANITDVPKKTYSKEIAVYNDNSFLSNVFAMEGGSSFNLSSGGEIKNSGYKPTKLYFIVGKNFTKGELYFNDILIQSIEVD